MPGAAGVTTVVTNDVFLHDRERRILQKVVTYVASGVCKVQQHNMALFFGALSFGWPGAAVGGVGTRGIGFRRNGGPRIWHLEVGQLDWTKCDGHGSPPDVAKQ